MATPLDGPQTRQTRDLGHPRNLLVDHLPPFRFHRNPCFPTAGMDYAALGEGLVTRPTVAAQLVDGAGGGHHTDPGILMPAALA